MSASTPRQIVLCCDGTNNNLTGGENDTNVVRLCHLLRQHGDTRQLVFYDPGVGNPGELPGATVWDSINRYGERLAGLAFGRGVYENMAECYQFLMSSYQPGDEIYVFGFSRGAFTARSVAGRVNMFGILQPHMVSMVPSLLHVYFSDRGSRGDSARRIARQATQLFADPFGPGAVAADENGDVGTQAQAQRGQCILVQTGVPEPVQDHQHRRGVRRAAAEPTAERNVLFDDDVGAFCCFSG